MKTPSSATRKAIRSPAGQWLEILARVGALARADGLELEISEDPLTGEIRYRVKESRLKMIGETPK